MRFKVGDRVRITDRAPDNTTGCEDCYGRGDIGKEGIVIKVDPVSQALTYRVDDGAKYYGWFPEEHLELVTEPRKGLENTVVHLPTQEEYDEYMKIVEGFGWKWCTGKEPTQVNYWGVFKENYCVKAEDNFSQGDVQHYSYEKKTIITLQEFKEKMGVAQEKLQEEIKNDNKTFMSKITTYIKNATLSADEKLLRKHGLKDECGEFTSEAREAVIAKLVADHTDYLVGIAKAIEAEENPKKK